MRIIAELSETIEDFIDQADDYIKCAVKNKSINLDVANAYYNMSIQRLTDIKTFHDVVAKIIKDYRTENGEPPKEMMAIYNYEHTKHINKVNNIKVLQNTYKEL